MVSVQSGAATEWIELSASDDLVQVAAVNQLIAPALCSEFGLPSTTSLHVIGQLFACSILHCTSGEADKAQNSARSVQNYQKPVISALIKA